MYLALRRIPATDATWLDKLFLAVIKARLVTEFPHAGMVINGTLYHATARHGVCKTTDYTPERWVLHDLGTERDAVAQAKAELLVELGTGYDFAELLDFTPLHFVVWLARLHPKLRVVLDSNLYCYQLCWLLMTSEYPDQRVTPERLLALKAANFPSARLVSPTEV